MSEYLAPLRDMRFVLFEVFDGASLWSQWPALQDVIDQELQTLFSKKVPGWHPEQYLPLTAPEMRKAVTFRTLLSLHLQASGKPIKPLPKAVGLV